MRKEIDIVYVVLDTVKCEIVGVFAARWAATKCHDGHKKPENLTIIERTVRKR